jgi:hypothetical protein
VLKVTFGIKIKSNGLNDGGSNEERSRAGDSYLLSRNPRIYCINSDPKSELVMEFATVLVEKSENLKKFAFHKALLCSKAKPFE